MNEQKIFSDPAQTRSNDIDEMVNGCKPREVVKTLHSVVEREKNFLETKENGKLAVSRTGLVIGTAHKMEEAGLCVNQVSNTNEEGECNKQKLDDIAGTYYQQDRRFVLDV